MRDVAAYVLTALAVTLVVFLGTCIGSAFAEEWTLRDEMQHTACLNYCAPYALEYFDEEGCTCNRQQMFVPVDWTVYDDALDNL